MKRIVILIGVLSIMLAGYSQYYPTETPKKVSNLPPIPGMEKPKPKPAAKPAQAKPAANPTTTQQNYQELDYQVETVYVHDTLYIQSASNEQYEGLANVVKNMLSNSFMEMKLSNFSGSRFTVAVMRNQGYAFVKPLPSVFKGQKNYSSSKACYEDLDIVEYRMLGQQNFTKLEKSFVTADYASDFLTVTMPESFTNGGVQVKTPSGRVNGLMVWFVKADNSSPVEMEVVPLEVGFTSSSSVRVKQPDFSNVIAGAFVGISSDVPGYLGVTLYAMANENGNQWELVKVQNGDAEGNSSSVNAPSGSSSRSGSEPARGGGERGERGGGGR